MQAASTSSSKPVPGAGWLQRVGSFFTSGPTRANPSAAAGKRKADEPPQGPAVAPAERGGLGARASFAAAPAAPAAAAMPVEKVDRDFANFEAHGKGFGSKMLAKIFTGNFAVRRMLRAAPALRELAMLDAVGQIADGAKGKRVVVDMPATGHGLAWLRLPSQMRDLFGSGGLYELSERLVHRLVAPRATSVVVVTLPERMVLAETLELCAALGREVGMPAARLVVNRFPAPVPEGAVAQAKALSASDHALGDPVEHLLEILQARESARAEALETLAHAPEKGLNIRPLLLPQVAFDPQAEQVAEWLAREKAA